MEGVIVAIVIQDANHVPVAIFSGDMADERARKFIKDRPEESLSAWAQVANYAGSPPPPPPYPIRSEYKFKTGYTREVEEDLPYCVIGRTAQRMSRQDRSWYRDAVDAENHAESLLKFEHRQEELLVVKIQTIIRRTEPLPPPIERIRVK